MEFNWDRPLRLTPETADFFLRAIGVKRKDPYCCMLRRLQSKAWPSRREGRAYYFVPAEIAEKITREVPNVAA